MIQLTSTNLRHPAIDAHPPSIPQMGDLQLPFDEAIKQLEGLVGLRASYTRGTWAAAGRLGAMLVE